jgi:ABC-2 type transport system permease protein
VNGPGTVRLIARREFRERLRDRGFAISTAITLLILCAFIVAGSLFGGTTRFDLGTVGDTSATVGRQVVLAAKALDVEITLVAYANLAEAERAVRDGAADAVLVDDATGS